MSVLFKNAQVYSGGTFRSAHALWDGVRLSFPQEAVSAAHVVENALLLPGLCDVHVHLREPGFSYKETISTGTLAAAHGGYTSVCAMPNLSPVPDSAEHLRQELALIQRDGRIRVLPYGSLTVEEAGAELADIPGMAASVCAFSDDGKGVQSEAMMESAMEAVKRSGRILAAHCEVNALLNGGYIHAGRYAAAHGHRGIVSESEYGQVARDIALARKTGCPYHVCHISTKESVELIRRAKAEGVDITCETGPHYLLLTEDDLQEDGRFKMNPPLRSAEDREALLLGLQDGTIDMIATDHAPHSAEEKSRGLEKSAMGIVGLETSFPLLYTHLVQKGVISLEKLVELMAVNPKKRFSIHTEQDFTVFQTRCPHILRSADFLSMGKATPFEGWQADARCVLTVCRGKAVYTAPEYLESEDA